MTAPDHAMVRRRQALVWGAVMAASLVLVKLVIPAMAGIRAIPDAILFRSLVEGLIASLTTCGLILIFRISRIINFAQVAIGSAGAQLCFLFVRYTPKVPFILALLIGLAVSAGTGVLFHVIFGRRFANAPRLVLTIATITGAMFLSQQLGTLTAQLPFFPPIEGRADSEAFSHSLRPYLPFSGFTFTVGDSNLEFGFPELLAIDLTLLAFLGLFLFFRFSRTGVAVRALAENPELASLLGIGVGLLGSAVWAVAGALGASAAIAGGLVGLPIQAVAFSPLSLLTPLTAAVAVRFASLPRAVGATIVISVVAGCTSFALVDDPGVVPLALFVIVAVALLGHRGGTVRTDRLLTTTWPATVEPQPIPRELADIPLIRVTRHGLISVAVLALLILPVVVDTGVVTLAASVATTAIVALSLVVLTGWAGQASLGQFSFVAIGSVVEAALAVKVGVPFWIAVPLTAAVTAVVAAVVGLPALRVEGLLLAVMTFAFSVALLAVLFDDRYFAWLLVRDRVPRPTLFFLDFDDERNMYYLCVAAFLLAAAVVVNLRHSRVGRMLIAARENGTNLQSFGIPLVRTKLLAFALSGGLAGFAGAVLVHQLRTLSASTYTPEASLNLFVYTVIGGASSVAGGLLGAAFPLLGEYVAGSNPVLHLLLGFVPVVVLFAAPGGLIGIVLRVRDAGLRLAAQRRHLVVPSLLAGFEGVTVVDHRLIPLAEPQPASGLAALHPTHRYVMQSRYHGHGRSQEQPDHDSDPVAR